MDNDRLARALDQIREGQMLQTHLQANFFPPLPSKAFDVATEAIGRWRDGERTSELAEIMEALFLWKFVFDESIEA